MFAVFQMFAHGLITAMLFMVCGMTGHKVGTREIPLLGGLAGRLPVYATFMMIAFMASLGLPGLVGFWGEFPVIFAFYEFILENNVIDARQAIHICGTHDVAIVGNELYGSVSWWDDPFKRSTPFWKPHSPVLDQMLVRCTTGGCRLYNNVMKLPVSCPLDARSVSVGNLVVSNRAAFAAAKRSAAFVPVDTATLGTNTLGQAFERRDGSPYVWRQAAEKTAAVSTTHNERKPQ